MPSPLMSPAPPTASRSCRSPEAGNDEPVGAVQDDEFEGGRERRSRGGIAAEDHVGPGRAGAPPFAPMTRSSTWSPLTSPTALTGPASVPSNPPPAAIPLIDEPVRAVERREADPAVRSRRRGRARPGGRCHRRATKVCPALTRSPEGDLPVAPMTRSGMPSWLRSPAPPPKAGAVADTVPWMT